MEAQTFQHAGDRVCHFFGEAVAGKVQGISVTRKEEWVDWRGEGGGGDGTADFGYIRGDENTDFRL